MGGPVVGGQVASRYHGRAHARPAQGDTGLESEQPGGGQHDDGVQGFDGQPGRLQATCGVVDPLGGWCTGEQGQRSQRGRRRGHPGRGSSELAEDGLDPLAADLPAGGPPRRHYRPGRGYAGRAKSLATPMLAGRNGNVR